MQHKLIMENWRRHLIKEFSGFEMPSDNASKQILKKVIQKNAKNIANRSLKYRLLTSPLTAFFSILLVPSSTASDEEMGTAYRPWVEKVQKEYENEKNKKEDEEEDNELNCAFASDKMLEVYTEQDRVTRLIVLVEHPDKTVTAYFKSSGVSRTGAKGRWIPFEGYSTSERVPKGLSYKDFGPDGVEPYGLSALLAKTYYYTPGAPIPPKGTKHDLCSKWLSRMEASGELMKLEKKPMEIGLEWKKAARTYARINRVLAAKNAIDRSRPVLSINAKGRRLQYGLDTIS